MPKRFTKEEEELLKSFSRGTTNKSAALFYVHAFIVALVPLWLYWQVYEVDPISSPIIAGVEALLVTALCTLCVSYAYKNVKFVLKHKLAQKIEDAVTQEINKLGDKVPKNDRDDRILFKKQEVSDYLAENYSIFYNNAMFLFLLITLSVLFANANPFVNYAISVGTAGGLVAFLSTGGH